jgi:hypothetical protein
MAMAETIPNGECVSYSFTEYNTTLNATYQTNMTFCAEQLNLSISLSCPEMSCPSVDLSKIPQQVCQCNNFTIPECAPPIVNIPENFEFGWRTTAFIVLIIVSVIVAIAGFAYYLHQKESEKREPMIDDSKEKEKARRLEEIGEKRLSVLDDMKSDKIDNLDGLKELERLKHEKLNIMGGVDDAAPKPK